MPARLVPRSGVRLDEHPPAAIPRSRIANAAGARYPVTRSSDPPDGSWNSVGWSPAGASRRELRDPHGVAVGSASTAAPTSVERERCLVVPGGDDEAKPADAYSGRGPAAAISGATSAAKRCSKFVLNIAASSRALAS